MGVNRVFERPSDKKRGNTGSPRDCSAFFLFLFFSVFLLKKNETMESKIPYRKANEHYETVFLVEAQLFGISRTKSKDKNLKIVAIVFCVLSILINPLCSLTSICLLKTNHYSLSIFISIISIVILMVTYVFLLTHNPETTVPPYLIDKKINNSLMH